MNKNEILDPMFMFLILPKGYEVLAAGIATFISNVISMIYFIFIYSKLKNITVLELPKRIENIGKENVVSLYSVGFPAAFNILLFDTAIIVINKTTASYGDIPLAAMGIVLKLERIPIQIGLGVCFALPFVLIGYHIVNFMNAIGKGKTSFLLAIIRHLILVIPIMLIMNRIFGMTRLIYSQYLLYKALFSDDEGSKRKLPYAFTEQGICPILTLAK